MKNISFDSSIVAIVQARMGSNRLPGKVMMSSFNKPILLHLIERIKISRHIKKIVIATSSEPLDDAIECFCIQNNISCFRGSENDVLNRYKLAALKFNAEIVVRITADCPLIDYRIVDHAIELFINKYPNFELVTNRFPLTFPDGLDVDVMDINSLIDAEKNANDLVYREHVVPYFWGTNRRFLNFTDPDNGFKTYRWTLDYLNDFHVISSIINNLYPTFGPQYVTENIISFLKNRPELVKYNSIYIH